MKFEVGYRTNIYQNLGIEIFHFKTAHTNQHMDQLSINTEQYFCILHFTKTVAVCLRFLLLHIHGCTVLHTLTVTKIQSLTYKNCLVSSKLQTVCSSVVDQDPD
jgi:hypothetical protein